MQHITQTYNHCLDNIKTHCILMPQVHSIKANFLFICTYRYIQRIVVKKKTLKKKQGEYIAFLIQYMFKIFDFIQSS